MDRLSTHRLNREEVVALLEAANAENVWLRAKLKKYEEDEEWLRECDVYAALQEEIEKTDRQAEDYHGAIAWRDTEIARLRRALLAAPEPSYDIGRYIGASVGYRSWYQGQRQAALGLEGE